MAEINPPSYLENGTYHAYGDRLTIGALWVPGQTPVSVRGGIRPSGTGTELLVAPSSATAATKVIVQPGTVVIPAAAGTACYVCSSDTPVTLTPSPALPSQSRIDLVVARVQDTAAGGLADQWALEIVAGTPTSGTPVVPAVPVNAWPLAQVRIAAGTTLSIAAGDVTDRRGTRTVAVGGITPTTSTALPANPYKGQAVYLSDTNQISVWDGGAWRSKTVQDDRTPSAVAVYATEAQTFPSPSVWYNMIFRGEADDVENFHSPTNYDRINIGARLGLWRIDGSVLFTPNNTTGTTRRARIATGGGAVKGSLITVSSAADIPSAVVPTTYVRATAATDWVVLQALHNGTNVGTYATAEAVSSLSAEWVRP